MKIRLWSDIHLEFGNMKFTEREDDRETVLVIAGDFQVGTHAEEFLTKLCARFKAVVYTTGNHEYYGQVMQKVDQALTDLSYSIKNFHFLNPGYAIIDDVKFIGGTMWTDFNKGDPVVMQIAKYTMNDYRKIKYIYNMESDANHYYPISPEAVYTINRKHREFICAELDKGFDGKMVVVTHHPPIEECAKNKFYDPTDPLTFCYCNTGLEEWVVKADYWLHGHIHNWSNVELGKCKIIAKPRGYIGHQTCAYEYDLLNKDAEIIEL